MNFSLNSRLLTIFLFKLFAKFRLDYTAISCILYSLVVSIVFRLSSSYLVFYIAY